MLVCAALLLCPQGAMAQSHAPAYVHAPGVMCSNGGLGPVACIRPDHAAFDICQHIEDAARRHILPPGFFARLLWQESRFDANALSPAGAQGIAQFMPGTAKLRGFSDAYNPAEAMERSAHYLGELVRVYGNPGLAAVAYNGGERRADGFVAGGGLARETINYVPIITGLSAEVWRDAPPKIHDFRLDADVPFMRACLEMAKTRRVSALSPPRPRWQLWGVQVGFGKTKDAARANIARLTRQCGSALGKERIEYIPVKSRVKGRPPYIMGRVGRSSRARADALCRQLARAGCVCRVYRNPD